MLLEESRMSTFIRDFPSRQFYHRRLRDAGTVPVTSLLTAGYQTGCQRHRFKGVSWIDVSYDSDCSSTKPESAKTMSSQDDRWWKDSTEKLIIQSNRPSMQKGREQEC
eukprot:gb/GECG01006271.1/.p1 GENE.gb/GECG01006271.1/~~gb/GECG01006271.1/.p1  ORF type:complete len:108 (+),score=13.38 gb/GECG01006271.1/:1-324(+)